MSSSETSLVALKDFKRNGYAFKKGDEIDTKETGIHRFLLAALVRDRKLGFGVIERTWKEFKKEKETPPEKEEVPEKKVQAKLKRKGGKYYDVCVGDQKLNGEPLLKEDAKIFMENYNG